VVPRRDPGESVALRPVGKASFPRRVVSAGAAGAGTPAQQARGVDLAVNQVTTGIEPQRSAGLRRKMEPQTACASIRDQCSVRRPFLGKRFTITPKHLNDYGTRGRLSVRLGRPSKKTRVNFSVTVVRLLTTVQIP